MTPAVEPNESAALSRHDLLQAVKVIPAWKRFFDFFAALFLATLLSPLLVLISMFIRTVSKGPVIFRQRRYGQAGKPFSIWKFRTMGVLTSGDTHRDYVKSLEKDRPFSKPANQSRLIPGGAIMRRLSLDELPQLWNVLRGEMSLVGPRPDVLAPDDYETEQELRRFEVLPGITGLWQVSGKNELSFRQMIALDIRYVEELSLLTDLRILLRTAFVVLWKANS